MQDVFPDQKLIDRTFINTWQDKRVVDAVRATGRKQLVLAALWTEICLAMPALQALADGYDVFIVTDASAGVSAEAHDIAVRPRRMLAMTCPDSGGQVLVNSNTVISGRAPSRMGKAVVPMPRLT